MLATQNLLALRVRVAPVHQWAVSAMQDYTTEHPMTEKLKPCPFNQPGCKPNARLVGGVDVYWLVECQNADDTLAVVHSVQVTAPRKNAAFAAWNRRVKGGRRG